MRRLSPWIAAALAAALLLAGGCGGSPKHKAASDDAKGGTKAVKECRQQWADVGDSVLGMDEDQHPSALAQRWTTVIATVDYHKQTDTAKDCQARVEQQLLAITDLRQFSEKLRPYDMELQAEGVAPAVDLYVHDALPPAYKGDDGKPVKPPTQAQVQQAYAVLKANASAANAELQPGWQETLSVDLSDDAAVQRTLKDLDFLAQDSPHWRTCEQALQVITRAVRAQEAGGN